MADVQPRPLPRPAEAVPGTSRPVLVYRCRQCRQIIAEAADGSCVRIKCAKCNTWNIIDVAA